MNQVTNLYNTCHKLLDYNHKTGDLFWKVYRGSAKPNKKAGHNHINGYITLRIRGRNYLAHRICYLMYYGRLPKNIDHINQMKSDNRISNLRECDYYQNNTNRPTPKNNSSGYKGVHWDKKGKKFHAKISVNGKRIYLGSFDCKHEAARVYNTYSRMHNGEFSYINEVNV